MTQFWDKLKIVIAFVPPFLILDQCAYFMRGSAECQERFVHSEPVCQHSPQLGIGPIEQPARHLYHSGGLCERCWPMERKGKLERGFVTPVFARAHPKSSQAFCLWCKRPVWLISGSTDA